MQDTSDEGEGKAEAEEIMTEEEKGFPRTMTLPNLPLGDPITGIMTRTVQCSCGAK